MEVPSVQKLCEHLISSAIQRCRVSDDYCRLSVVLKSSPLSDPPLVGIAISDTGIGSCLGEFQDLKCSRNLFLASSWDGVIVVATTGIHDGEIYHYNINVKEISPTRKLIKLPSKPKNSAKFSGTEVSFSTTDDLLVDITCFLRKILILKIPKLAIELVADSGDIPGSQIQNPLLVNESSILSPPSSSIECLKSGLEDYIFKHGNHLNHICHSCFSNREHLKFGSGVACSKESRKNGGLVMEAVIIISHLPDTTSPCCFTAYDSKTEVLYFKDFSPCSISQSSLNALTSIDWKTYGLTLKSIADQHDFGLLEWENLPASSHIYMVLHCYHKQVVLPPGKQNTKLEQTLARKAIKLALNGLKEKNAGVLLSDHALKICSYVPDLAKTIAALILSSNDSGFQGECLSLLGLKTREIKRETVADCIKEKIISVVEMNDKKPQTREAAPFLFQDDCFPDDEHQEGEFSPMESMDL